MRSTNYWPRLTPTTAGVDDRFEELRVAYYARLRSDRAQVATLRQQLAQADDPRPVYEAIRLAAHGMAGAAAIFEAADIMQAARKLEHAAGEATRAEGAAADTAVRPLVDALIELLDTICN